MEAYKPKPLTAEDEELLRDSLKRCSPETLEAALAFRKDSDISGIHNIVIGIIERFLEPDVRPMLKKNPDDLKIFDDLGIDSLTLVELVMMVEETLDMSIDNNELRELVTVGDVKQFIDCKIQGVDVPAKPKQITIADIVETIPHGQPFMFLQSAAIGPEKAEGSYSISGNEFFLEGHFKDNPVFPASIMLEALGQLAVLFLLKSEREELAQGVDKTRIFFKSCDGIRCNRFCKPGDTLSMSVKAKRIKHPMATFEGSITVNGEKAAFAEEISLLFDFVGSPEGEPKAELDKAVAVSEPSAES